jgi:hypothetical protein
MMRVGVAVGTSAVVLASVGTLGLALRAEPPTGATSLAIAGRSNATPWVASDGPLVAVVWGASIAGKTDVFVAVSHDSGKTFGTSVQVNTIPGEARLGGELPPRVAVTAGRGPSTAEVVVLWTARGAATSIKTARSRDGGRTFEPAVELQGADAAGDRGWPSLALDGRGAAHAIWLDHRGLAAARAANASRDHRSGAAHDGVAMAQKSGLYYAAGTPTSGRELAKGVCYCCKTALAAGADQTVYAAWRHVYQGNIRDIAFTVSRDGGRSFDEPIRVSDDTWAINGCPDDGPAIAVDSQGEVHLAWPTVVGGPNPEGALFYASTRDGRTFTPRTRIPTLGSARPTHPQIVVDRRGRIVVAWDELVNGQRMAAAREVSKSGQRVDFGPVITLSPGNPATYPVLAATSSGVVAVWTTGGDAATVEARAISLP